MAELFEIQINATLAKDFDQAIQKQLDQMGKKLKINIGSAGIDEANMKKALSGIVINPQLNAAEFESKIAFLQQKIGILSASSYISKEQEQALQNIQNRLSGITSGTQNAAQEFFKLSRQISLVENTLKSGKLLDGINPGSVQSLRELQNELTKVYNKDVEVKRLNAEVIKNGQAAYRTFTAEAKNLDGTFTQLKGTINLSTGEVRVLENEVQKSNNTMRNLRQTMFGLVSFFVSLPKLINTFRKALSVIWEVDKQLVTIQKVTRRANEDMAELESRAYSTGSAFGRSADLYLSAVKDFSKAGYGQHADELGKLSLLTQNVGEVSAETANEFLLSVDAAWKFNGEITELTRVLDGFNDVGNKNATDIQKLADGIRVAGSVFASAGLDVSEYAAIIGTATTVTQQSGREMGTAWRTILMNLRQIKGTTEDGGIIDEASFKKAGIAIESLGVKMTYVEDGIQRLRPVMDILNDLAVVWARLNEEGRNLKTAELAEAMGGKMRANALIAVLDNWDKVLKMQDEYNNASGSAARENEIYMQSLQAKAEILKNTWVEMVSKDVSREFIKSFLDSGITLLNLLGNIRNAAALLVGVFMALKAQALTASWAKQNQNLKDYFNNMMLVVTGNQKFALSEKARALSTDLADKKTMMARANMLGYTTVLNSALGIIGLAITAYTILSMAVQNYNQKLAEARQKTIASGQETANDIKALDDYKDKISELRNVLDEGNLSQTEATEIRKEIMGIQDEIIKKYGLESDAISMVNGDLEEQIRILEELAQEEAKKWLRENQAQINAANRYLNTSRKMELSIGNINKDNPLYEYLQNQVEELGGVFQQIEHLAENGQVYDGAIKIRFEGPTYEEQYALVTEIYNNIEEFGHEKDLSVQLTLEPLSVELGEINNEIFQEHLEIRDQYVGYTIMIEPDTKDFFAAIEDVKREYSNAVREGNDKAANDAAKRMLELKKEIETAELPQIKTDALKNMLQEQLTPKLTFELEFEASKERLQALDSDVAAVFEQVRPVRFGASIDDGEIAGEIDRIMAHFEGLDNVAILDLETKGTEEQIEAFGELSTFAEKYQLSVEQLIDVLVEFGIVQEANPIEISVVKNMDEVNKEIDSLQSAIQTLTKAQQEYADAGYLTVDTVQGLLALGDDYLQYLNVTEDAITLNTEAVEDQVEALKNEMIAAIQAGLAIEILGIIETDTQQSTDDLAVAAESTENKFQAMGEAAINCAGDLGVLWGVIIGLNAELEGTDPGGISDDAQKKIIEATKNAQNQINIINSLGSGLSGLNSKKSSSKGSGSKKDEWKEAFNAELKELQYHYDAGLISEENYLHQKRAQNEKYFKDKKDYLDDYRKYEIEVTKGLNRIEEKRLQNDINGKKKSLSFMLQNPVENTDAIYAVYGELDSIYADMQKQAHETANHYRQLGFDETSIEIQEQKLLWMDYRDYRIKLQDDVYAHGKAVMEDTLKDTNNAVALLEESVSDLGYEYNNLADNQVPEKIQNITARSLEQEKIAHELADAIEYVNQLYQEGKISTEDYDAALDSLNGKLKTTLRTLEELDRDKVKIVDQVIDAYYDHIFSEKQKEIDALKKSLQDIEDKYKKQTDAISDQIAALKERNKEEENRKKIAERLLEIEKLRLELENVRNEKNIRQLTKKEDGSFDFEYVTDQSKIDNLENQIRDKEKGLEELYAQDALDKQIKALEDRQASLDKQKEAEKSALNEMIDRLQSYLDDERELYSNRNKLLITSAEDVHIALADIDAAMYGERLAYLKAFNESFYRLAAGQEIGVAVSDDMGEVDRFWQKVHEIQGTHYNQEQIDMDGNENKKGQIRDAANDKQKLEEEKKNAELLRKLRSFLDETQSRTKTHHKDLLYYADQLRIALNNHDQLTYNQRLDSLRGFVSSWNSIIESMREAAMEASSSYAGSIGSYSVGGVVPTTGVKLLHEGERVLTVEQTQVFDRLLDQLTLEKSFDTAPAPSYGLMQNGNEAAGTIFNGNVHVSLPEVKNVNDFARAMRDFPALVRQEGFK